MDEEFKKALKRQGTESNDRSRKQAFESKHGDSDTWARDNRHLPVNEQKKKYRTLAQQALDDDRAAKLKHTGAFVTGAAIVRGDIHPVELLSDNALVHAIGEIDDDTDPKVSDVLRDELRRRELDR